jgi:hypothetical protein
LVLIPHTPCSHFGPYIFRKIFLSHVVRLDAIFAVIAHVSLPYNIPCFQIKIKALFRFRGRLLRAVRLNSLGFWTIVFFTRRGYWPCAQPPTWRIRPPYLYPPETGWPSYTPRHWVPILVASYDYSYSPVATQRTVHPYMKQFVTCRTVDLLGFISLPLGVVTASDLPTGWLHIWYCPNYLLATPCPSDIQREPKLSLLGVGHICHPVTPTLFIVDLRPYHSPVYGNLWMQETFRLYFNA